MKTLLSLLLFGLVSVAFAQRIENVSASFTGGRVIIRYDIADSNPDQKYNVNVYSSLNAFANPLVSVTGDVGQNLSGGLNKEVLWSPAQELGTFNGELTFKVSVEVIPLPFVFKNPTVNGKVRRGTTRSVEWEGGITGQNVRLEIFKGNEQVASSIETQNTGQFNWAVPKDLSKGEDYTLQITGANQTTTSEVFRVKPKIPFIVKISPLIIGAIVIPFVVGGDDTPGTENEKVPLAAAPNPN